ncbi:MAG TPA: hypothetical protein VGL57_02020 [Solirubrobacteraceae bacterium]|jgi:hypothetical protein
MKNMRALGIALAAIFAISAMSASAATAASWYLQGSPLTKAEKVSSETTITFEESGTGIALQCERVYREGLVNPGVTGEITSILQEHAGSKQIRCKVIREGSGRWARFCPENKDNYVEAVNLPWHTELETIGEKLRDVISGENKLPAEFHIQCEGAPVIDCFAETNTSVTNVSQGVELATDSNSPTSSCAGFGGKLHLGYHEVLKAASGKVLAVK